MNAGNSVLAMKLTVNAMNSWCHRSCCPSIFPQTSSSWCLSKDPSHLRSFTQTTLFCNRWQVYL